MQSTFSRLLVFASIILLSCAKVGSPDGGPKDEDPPKIVSSSPENYSKNIKPKRIELEFNEFITLGNYQAEWIISPPLPEKAEAKLRGKKLIIDLPDSLEENTTYIINFAESIGDLHEDNKLEENLFVFSTGDFIDSGKVGGEVFDAVKDVALENMAVGLFKLTDSSSFPPKTPPSYYAISQKDGSFAFDFLKDQAYYLIAWEDENKNKVLEDNERLGFASDSIFPGFTESNDSIQLRLYKPAEDTLRITKSRLVQNRKIQVEFNSGPKDTSLNIYTDSIAFIDHFVDSSVVWYQQERTQDSVVLYISSATFSDTLSFFPISGINKREGKRMAVGKKVFPGKPSDSLKINFPEPPKNDSLALQYFHPKDSIWLDISAYRNPRRSNQFYLVNPGTFGELIKVKGNPVEGIYEHITDTLKFNYAIPSKEDLGNLALMVVDSIVNIEDAFFLFGLENQLRPYPFNGGKLEVKYLKPGAYLLYLVEDWNGDGKITPGNPNRRLQPERVYKFDQGVEVRANWDLELDWIID